VVRTSRSFRCFLLLAAVAFLTSLAPAAPEATPETDEKPFRLTNDETLLLRLVNAEREEHGLRPLDADVLLVRVARSHSADMAKRGYFSHLAPKPAPRTPLDRFAAALGSRPPKTTIIGENIGRAREPVMSMIHITMMRSPEHRANILDHQYARMGVGIFELPDGRVWVTEVYQGGSAQTR
jgi:uncharacterized protein YkwD